MAEPDKMLHEQAADIIFGREPVDAQAEPETPLVANPAETFDEATQDHQDSEADGPPVEPDNSESEADGPAATPPGNWADMAKKLGVEASELYEVKIPLGKGDDSFTVSEAKHRMQELRTVDELRAATEDERDAFQAERLKYQQELEVVGKALQSALQTGSVDESVIQQAQQAYQTQIEHEDQVARAAAPELAKDGRRGEIESILSKYGAPKGVMQSGVPAWMQLALNRLTTLEQRLERAKAKQDKPKPKKPKPAGKQSKSPDALVKAARSGRISPEQAARGIIFGS